MSPKASTDCLPLPLKETLSSLPPESRSPVRSQTLPSPGTPKLVILDDDPTGTQTCHGIAVLTVWDTSTLQFELLSSCPGFFILTNSRAFPPTEVHTLIKEICENLQIAAAAAAQTFEVVLRGDSTLRGHFPLELEIVEEVFGKSDAWILAPFFHQGGRYTINDVHYVLEKDMLIPAGQTPFASDASFGFRSSNLRDYIQEKAPGRFKPEDIVSVTLDDIRYGGPSRIEEKLLALPSRSIVIVNAAAESDMDVFSAGLLVAESHGKKFLFRTAAAFVSSRLGIIPKSLVSARDIGLRPDHKSLGGLIVAGSYVPKTTAQLNSLISLRGDKLRAFELNVTALISNEKTNDDLISSIAKAASSAISEGHDVLIMTSRTLIKGNDAVSSLSIGGCVATALVKIVQRISARPRYIIVKGGITSSDVATKALCMRRAMVLGQAAPGVPLWRCDEETSQYASVPYVVFPGNVGEDDALAKIVESWSV